MRNLLWLVVIALAIFIIAGCTGILAGAAPASGPVGPLPASSEPVSHDKGPVTDDGFTQSSPETKSYHANLTQANAHPLTRKEFLDSNREYMLYLSGHVGNDTAEKIVNDEYTRSITPLLLNPGTGDDTLVSLTIDPIGNHAAGAIIDIGGSTNLPADTELTLVLFRGNFLRPISPDDEAWHDPISRTAYVLDNSSLPNTWKYTLDSYGLVPDDYVVYVRESLREPYRANTVFSLLPRPQ